MVCLFIAIFVAVRYLAAIFFMFALAFVPLHFVEFDAPHEISCVDSATLVRRVRIVAGGDFMQHTPQMQAARLAGGGYDYTPSLKYVSPMFRDADLAIINLETTLSKSGPYSGYPCFVSPAEVAEAMRDMGVDVAAMANNHCLDRGRRGVYSTTEILDSLGIKRIGVFRDSVDYRRNRICYLNLCDISFAVVNYTYGTNGIPVPKGCGVARLDTVAMAVDFDLIARDSVDCLVAVVHWGLEYERKPNAEQRRLEQFMRRKGVDIIIGSHPHVVQPYVCDSVQGVTLYSLGNFVSNQRKRYCDGGIVATIDIERRADGQMRYGLGIEPVWVQKPHYRLIPQSVGDTLQMTSADREAYNIFMEDVRAIDLQSRNLEIDRP